MAEVLSQKKTTSRFYKNSFPTVQTATTIARSSSVRTSRLEVLPKGSLMVLPMQSGAVKRALKVLPKIAVAVSPKRALDITKCLRWEKNKQGELEVLPKRALSSCKIGIFCGGIKTSGLEVLPKRVLTVLPMQSGTIKGSTQGASQDSSCSAFQGSTKGASQYSNRKFLWWEKQAGSTRGAAQFQ